MAVTVAACGSDEVDVWWPPTPPVTESDSAAYGKPLVAVDTILVPADQLVTAAGTFLDSDRVAIIDGSSCYVWIYTRSARTARKVNSRCGSGPGDLARPSAIAVVADSLRIVDAGANVLVTYDSALSEVRRLPLPPGVAGGAPSGGAAWGRDSVLLSVRRVTAVRRGMADEALAGVVSASDPSSIRWISLTHPRVVARKARPVGMTSPSCARPWGGTSTALILNAWAFQVAAMGPTDTLLWAWRRPSDGPVYKGNDRTNPGSRIGALGIACGESTFIAVQVGSDRPRDSDVPLWYRREVRTYAGAVIHRRVGLIGSSESLGLPIAGFGDEFLFSRTNRDGSIAVIYRVPSIGRR